jgi:hypothetical protein
MQIKTYEAMLARPETVRQARAQQRAIERLGGTLEISAPSATGMTLVRLTLPEPSTPADVLPELPFFLA